MKYEVYTVQKAHKWTQESTFHEDPELVDNTF